MATLKEAKQNISQQKETLESKKQNILLAKEKLERQKQKLPKESSKEALRNKFSGLDGRSMRRKIKGVKEEISKGVFGLENYKSQILDYEREKLIPAEQEVLRLEKQQRAYNVLNEEINKTIGKYEGEFTSARSITNVRNAFSNAGLDPDKGAELYSQGATLQGSQSLFSEEGEFLGTYKLGSGEVNPSKEFEFVGSDVGGLTFKKRSEAVQSLLPDLSRKDKAIIKGVDLGALQIDPVISAARQGEVQPSDARPSGFLEGALFDIRRSQERDVQRGGSAISPLKGAGASLLGTALFGKALVKDPIGTGKKAVGGTLALGASLLTGTARFPEAGRILREDPGFAFGFIGAEIGTGFLGGKGIKTGREITESLITRIDPRFKPLKEGFIRDIPTSQGLKEIEIGGGVSQLSEPLSSQARLAGKKVDAVSAQRGLFDMFEQQKIVDKPLPSPDAPPLERAFFADPKARLRPSRLGILDNQNARLLDILAGDVSFKRPKPQALLFPEIQIQKFPSSLRDVELKLTSGKPLNELEKARLLEFQLTPTEKFKPVGFLSREPEITLAPGETIIKKKTAGVTIIEGKRVPIFEVEVGQASKSTKVLLEELKQGTISKPNVKKLISQLKKETGIDYSQTIYKKFVSPGVLGSGVLSILSGSSPTSKALSGSQLFKGSSGVSSSPSPSQVFLSDGFSPLTPSGRSPQPSPSLITPSGSSSFQPSPRIPSGSSGVSFPPSPPPAIGILRGLSKLFPKRPSPKEGKGRSYKVGVVRNKKANIIKDGMNLNDARDLGALKALKTLAATFYIRKSNKKPVDVPDTNIFQNNRMQFRKPVSNSKLRSLGEEVWIQKKHKVQGVGSRLGSRSEVSEIFGAKDSSFNLGLGRKRKKGKRKKSIFGF